MEDEIQLYLEDTKERMDGSIEHLIKEFDSIRAGKAETSMLDGIEVDYYGSMTPLTQVANLNTPDARTIAIQPWEKSLIKEIETAIINANIGFTPSNNGEIVRINVPILTEERRRDLVKQVNKELENAKISIRSARRDANDAFKKMQKDGLGEDRVKDLEDEVQKLTDKYSSRAEEASKVKEAAVMTV